MERRLEHRDGTLAYEVVGDGAAVLMIQGVGVAGSGWRPQVEALSRAARCVTFDNRGLGRSQLGAAAVSVEQMADDARAILDAEGISTAHVIGHSLGGPVALALALAAPDRVLSLALLCTFAGSRTAAPPSLRLLWVGTRTRVGTRRMRRHAFLELVSAPRSIVPGERVGWCDRLSTLFGHDIADQPPVAAAQLRAMKRFDASERLHEISGIPTLVVSARHDPIAPPAAGRALAAGIRGARFLEIEDASHGLPITHADRVNGLLADHILAGAS